MFAIGERDIEGGAVKGVDLRKGATFANDKIASPQSCFMKRNEFVGELVNSEVLILLKHQIPFKNS